MDEWSLISIKFKLDGLILNWFNLFFLYFFFDSIEDEI